MGCSDLVEADAKARPNLRQVALALLLLAVPQADAGATVLVDELDAEAAEKLHTSRPALQRISSFSPSGVPEDAPQSFSISTSALRWSLSVRIGRICMVVVIIKIWRPLER